MANRRIKKGDTVIVIAGSDRGLKGEVIEVMPKQGRVVVDGVNSRKRHQRPSGPGRPSGLIDINAPVHISNVMLVDPASDKPTRIAKRTLEDGRRVRVAKVSGEVVDS